MFSLVNLTNLAVKMHTLSVTAKLGQFYFITFTISGTILLLNFR